MRIKFRELNVSKLFVVDDGGAEIGVDAKAGLSVMEILRDGGFEGLLALCGGSCSCATCHVHIDHAFLDLLSPMSDDENDLLETAEGRQENSRLSCQLQFTPALDGVKLRIVPQG